MVVLQMCQTGGEQTCSSQCQAYASALSPWPSSNDLSMQSLILTSESTLGQLRGSSDAFGLGCDLAYGPLQLSLRHTAVCDTDMPGRLPEAMPLNTGSCMPSCSLPSCFNGGNKKTTFLLSP